MASLPLGSTVSRCRSTGRVRLDSGRTAGSVGHCLDHRELGEHRAAVVELGDPPERFVDHAGCPGSDSKRRLAVQTGWCSRAQLLPTTKEAALLQRHRGQRRPARPACAGSCGVEHEHGLDDRVEQHAVTQP